MIAAMLVVQSSKSERLRRSIKYVAIVTILATFAVIWAGMSVLTSKPSQSPWMVSRGQAVLMSLLPWVVLAILIVAFTVWLSRNHLRRQWNSKPYLRRRRTVVLDGDGERSADGITEMLYRWSYFRRAWETENCLVLQDENDLRHILPKRVMDRATLDQARAVISNHVADCKFLTTPGGFPVATSAPPPG